MREGEMGRVADKVRSSIAAKILATALILVSPSVAQHAGPVSTEQSGRSVVISIPDRKLAVIADGNVIARFPVAVGAAQSPSPTGEFRIVSRVTNPTYYHPGTVIPSGKDNPVGTRWLGLSQKGYGIHGTNVPRSIGRAASHGCIRLRNRDMERLFSMLQIGDVVEIHGERDEDIAEIFGSQASETVVAETQVSPQTSGQ
jgi:lipoprotein-anchoring transpeptidase ErfK/SrfK